MKQMLSRFYKVFFALLMVWTQVQPAYAQDLPQENYGFGNQQFHWERDFFPNTQLEHVASENHVGLQKTHTIQFDPQKTPVEAHTVYGKSVMGGETLSQFIEQQQQDGKTVVFAINGDGYDTSNMNPLGLMVQDGVLITSSEANRRSVGFHKDGQVVFGDSNIVTHIDGMTVNHINRERKMNQSNLYLMTEAFGTQTDSTQEGIEVILKRSQNDAGVRIGTQETLEVLEVREVANNPQKNTTPIETGTAVLATHAKSSIAPQLRALTKGQNLTLDVENKSDVAWQDVQAGIGVFTVLMENGQVQDISNTDLNAHPRTVMGITEQGEVILMQNDGRQASFAEGMTYRDTVEILKAKGATTVFNFDGGGSSTMAAQLPGNDTPSILNKPSDGKQRSNANGLVFTSTLDPQETPNISALHLYPSNAHANRVVILEQGEQSFDVKATDASHNPVSLDNDDLVWSVSNQLGTIDSGVFKAGTSAGKGEITVQSKTTGISQSMPIEVVDTLTLLRSSKTMISVGPGKQTQLEFYGESHGTAVTLSNEALSFHLSDPSLGSINEQGVFSAEETSGTGNLTVRYKDYSITIPIEVGKLPVVLNGFEDELENNHWKWRFYNADGTRGGDGKMSINRDERFVKRGDASLRIDYDNATKPVTGTVTIEAGPEKGYGVLEGQPKAIGAWVYGDNSGAWIRIQLAPSVYAGDIKVNWHGWKYIETDIPDNAQYPYELVWGIRVLTLAGSPNNYKKGSIYIDELRAIYDYKNDDAVEPSRKADTALKPAPDSTQNPKNSAISLQVHDPISEDGKFTGIAMDRTRLWINGSLQDNVVQTLNQDNSVSIQYNPSALEPLRSGDNHIKVRVEDNAGNKYFETWNFNVEGYAVELVETVPNNESIATNETFEVKLDAKDYRQFESFEGVYTFDDTAVSLEDVIFDSQITESSYQLDGNTLHLKAQNMDQATVGAESFVTMIFKASDKESPSVAIYPQKIQVKDRTQTTADTLILKGYDAPVQIPYTLTVSGVTQHYPSSLTVRDRSGQGAENVGIIVTRPDGSQYEIPTRTDHEGNLLTSELTSYDVGSKLKLQARDASGHQSAAIDFEVMGSLGSDTATNVVITGKNDPSTAVGITWKTSLDVSSMTFKISEDANFATFESYTPQSVTIPMNAKGVERLTQGWAVNIDNLKPSTQYTYQIDEGHKASFTTGTDQKESIVKFYGDFQGGFDKLPEVEKASQAIYPTDVILQPGDFSDNHNDYHEWETIDQHIGDMTASKVWLPATGNHDVSESGDDQVYMNTFNTAKNGVSETGRDYYVDYGNTRFYVMDSEAHFSYDPNFKLQLAHMKKVFEASPQKFKAVMMHRPVYAMSYDEPWMRALAKDFEAMDIDLVLTGHDHIYSRTTMFQDQKVEIGAGPTYVVMGTSTGSKYYNADMSRPWTHVVYDDNTPTFGFLKMQEDAIVIESYTLKDGQTQEIDRFEIKKDVQKELEKMIQKVEQLERDAYTPASQKSLDGVLEAAKEALKGDKTEQEAMLRDLEKLISEFVLQDPKLKTLANLYRYALSHKFENTEMLQSIETVLNKNETQDADTYYQKLLQGLVEVSKHSALHKYVESILKSFENIEISESFQDYLQGTEVNEALLAQYMNELIGTSNPSIYDMMQDIEGLSKGITHELEKDRAVLAFLRGLPQDSDKEALITIIASYLQLDQQRQMLDYEALVKQLEEVMIARHNTSDLAQAIHDSISSLDRDLSHDSQINTNYQTLSQALTSLSAPEERVAMWQAYFEALNVSILQTAKLELILAQVQEFLKENHPLKNQELIVSLQDIANAVSLKMTQKEYRTQDALDRDTTALEEALQAVLQAADKTIVLEKTTITDQEQTRLRLENFEANRDVDVRIVGGNEYTLQTNKEGVGELILKGSELGVGQWILEAEGLRVELVVTQTPLPEEKPDTPGGDTTVPEEETNTDGTPVPEVEETPTEDKVEVSPEPGHDTVLPETGMRPVSMLAPILIMGLGLVLLFNKRKQN